MQVTSRVRWIVFALAGALALGAVVRGPGEAAAPETGKKRVAVVLSVGGLGDRSFNDMAYEGLQAARRDLGVIGVYGEPAAMSEDERYLDFYAEQGFDLVFAVGFLMKSALESAAKRHPGTSFAIIDEQVDLPNVASVRFREHEGCYLVGALASRKSKTGTVGIVLGMDVPLLRVFEHGWNQGVAAGRPGAKSLTMIANSFADPVRGKELTRVLAGQKADVVFQAAGQTGNGVITGAAEEKIFAVGCDANQNGEAPGTVLTSMLKRVDVAVLGLCREVVEGRFRPGAHSLGVKEGAIGWALDENNRGIVTADDEAWLRGLEAKIRSGELVVESDAPKGGGK
ncbi:MAG: BMP family ABC transporter substrate-binding protein [Planctomycetes bacterium]|nr:BMP family ABC transporter substrate-binding protein [Planctomycetota bacterium]